MSRNTRILILAAALVVGVAGFVIASSAGDEEDEGRNAATTPATTTTGRPATTPPQPPIPVIATRDGKPVGDVATIEVVQGERAMFRVTSNIPEEVHVHGVDVTKELGPGRPASFDVKANAAGRFEVELHDSGEQIAWLEVRP